MWETLSELEKRIWISAHHEAGHAALMVYFNWYGAWASNFVNESGLPKNCDNKVLFHSLEQVFQYIQILHAGEFATAIFKNSGHAFDTSGTADSDWNLIAIMQDRWKIPNITMQELENDAKVLVNELWPKVEEIAKEIVKDGIFVIRKG